MTHTGLPPFLHAAKDGFYLDVQAQPGARTTAVVGLHGGRLKIRVAAPPEDGRANQELCHYVADLCGLRKSAVSVQSGPASRSKRLLIVADAPIVAILQHAARPE